MFFLYLSTLILYCSFRWKITCPWSGRPVPICLVHKTSKNRDSDCMWQFLIKLYGHSWELQSNITVADKILLQVEFNLLGYFVVGLPFFIVDISSSGLQYLFFVMLLYILELWLSQNLLGHVFVSCLIYVYQFRHRLASP